MRRTSFVGAMFAIAIGAILAFAVNGTPKDLDLQAAGLLVMLGGAADLLVRFAIADSPLLSRQTAEVAAVVEPVGEPVLDAAGNLTFAPPPAYPAPAEPPRLPLVVPAQGTLPAGTYGTAPAPSSADAAYRRAVAADTGGLLDTPESPQALQTLTGRPVRPRRGAHRHNRPRRAE